jgi:hypothetical protein
MKYFIARILLLSISIFGIPDLTACEEEINYRSETTENLTPSQQTVYVCMGKYSEAYHSSANCRGLNNCSTKIYEINSDYAVTTLSRRPCCICWNVSSYNCGTDKQDNRYPGYISPLPADDFINAAIQKQRNYDAGKEIVQGEIDQLKQVRSQLIRNCDLVYFDKLVTNAVNSINNNNLDLSFQSHVNWAVNVARSVSSNEYISKSITSKVAYYQMVTEYNNLNYTQINTVQATNFYNYFMSWYNSDNAATTINYKSFYSF